jgi:hypothetical protein
MISSMLGVGSLDGLMDAGRALSRSNLGKAAAVALPALVNTARTFAPLIGRTHLGLAAGLLYTAGLWIWGRRDSSTMKTVRVVEALSAELVALRRGIEEFDPTLRQNAGLVEVLRSIEFQLQPAGIGAPLNDAPMTDAEISALFDRLIQLVQTAAERPTEDQEFLRVKMNIAQVRRRVDELKDKQARDSARIRELDAAIRRVNEEHEQVHREIGDLLEMRRRGDH